MGGSRRGSCAPAGARRTPLRALAVAFLTCLVLLLAPSTGTARWVSVGPSPGAASAAVSPLIDLMHDGTSPWVTWNDASYIVQVSSFNGTTWSSITSPGNGAGSIPTHPSLATNGTNMFVAYNDSAMKIQFKKWAAGAWTSIGTPVDNTTLNTVPHLMYAAGWFYLSYQDDSQVIKILRGDGTGTWAAYATSPGTGGAGGTYSELAWDGTTLVTTYNVGAGTQYVKRWNGATWDLLGTWAETENTTPTISVVNGKIIAGLNNSVFDAAFYMYTGSQWIDHGIAGNATNTWSYPSLAWSGSVLYAAHNTTNGIVQVERWEGPLTPIGQAAYRSDAATQIPSGQWTTDGIGTSIHLRFQGTHKTTSAVLTPWVEVRPLATAFSSACGASVAGVTFSGPNVTVSSGDAMMPLDVPVTGLTAGTEYHWRACAVDGAAIPSAWDDEGAVATFGVAATPKATLVPDTSRAATGSWGLNVLGACTRATNDANEPRSLDEEISTPNDAACSASANQDIVTTTSNPANAADEYELTDTPADLVTLTGVNVRIRLLKAGTRSADVTARLHLSGGAVVGVAVAQAATTSWAEYAYPLTGLSLTKAQADGMYVELAQVVGTTGTATTVSVSAINVDIDYSAVPTVMLSGTALAAETGAAWSQCDGSTQNIAISIGGAAPVRTSCAAGSGAYTRLIGVPSADLVIVAWLDPLVAGDVGAAYTRNADTTTAITGLTIARNVVGLRSQSITAISNASLDTYDSTQDADIPVASNGVTATITANQLTVRGATTFTPGGAVTAPSVHVLATGTWSAAANLLTVTGGGTGACDSTTAPAFCNDGALVAGTGTVRVTSTAGTEVRGDTTFATLDLLPGSGSPVIQLRGIQSIGTFTVGDGVAAVTAGTTWNPTLTVTGATTIAANATLAFADTSPVDLQGAVTVNGALSGAGTGTITARAAVQGSGSIDLTANRFEQRVAGGTTTFGSTAGASAWRFWDLQFSNASGASTLTTRTATGGSGDINVRGTLTVAVGTDTRSTTLDADTNDRVLDADGSVVIASPGILSASSASQMRIGGSVTSTGSITPNAGTITFDDASRVSTLGWAAATTLANVTVATPGKELRFDEADRTTLTGALTVNGAACATPVLLRSAVAANAFDLDVQGSAAVQFARVVDSTAITPRAAASTTDAGGNTGWTLNAGACGPSLSMSSGSVAVGSVVPGADTVASVTATIVTSSPSGYALLATDQSDTQALACPTCAPVSGVPDWTGSAAAPTTWTANTAGYGGVTVRDATGGRLAKWGTGTNTAATDYVNNLYAGLAATTSSLLHSRPTPAASDAVVLTFRLDVGATQAAGDYGTTIGLLALVNP